MGAFGWRRRKTFARCGSRVCVLVFMTLAASYALPTPDAIVPEMDDFFGNDAKALPFHAGDSPTPDDVVPEMTMMEHSQMPVTDKMEEAGMGQGHGSGEESENDGHEHHHHCQGGEQADGTFGLCMGSGDCRHGNNHCLEGVCNQEDGICKGTQGENSGPDGDGGEGGEDMAALLPYIQKCQAKLPAGDMCKTLDPMMCAHSDPPPASCDECKSRLMGCVKDAAGTGAGQGSGEGPDEAPEHDAGQGSGEGSEHDVVPEMTMMEHPQMPVTDKMEEAGMGQGHGSGEEPENDGHEHHHHC